MSVASELFKAKDFNVEIVSYGDSNLNDPRFQHVSIRESIETLSDAGKLNYFKTKNPTNEQIENAIKKYREQVGHEVRPFFNGTIDELALLSAKDCLDKGEILPRDIGKFSFVSNTVPYNKGYPSRADDLMESLSELYPGPEGLSNGYCKFSQEACAIGVIEVIDEAQRINTVQQKGSLIVASELATKLAHPDNWVNHNLFGDQSGAVFLRPGKNSFLGMGAKTFPYRDEKFSTEMKAKDLIAQNSDGSLFQNGRNVHKWVNSTFVDELTEALWEIGINPKIIQKIVFHQPSLKVNKTLKEMISQKWTGFTGKIYWDKNAGNTSSASTLSLMSRLLDSGKIKPGEIVLVAGFGSGLTWAFYVCIAPRCVKII